MEDDDYFVSESWPSECRDALDALACVEAVFSLSPTIFLDGVRSDSRHTLLPEVHGFISRRVLHSRGLNNRTGFRLFKAQIKYSYEPSPDSLSSSSSVLDPEVIMVYSFWGPTETYDETIKTTASHTSNLPPPRRSIFSGELSNHFYKALSSP